MLHEYGEGDPIQFDTTNLEKVEFGYGKVPRIHQDYNICYMINMHIVNGNRW